MLRKFLFLMAPEGAGGASGGANEGEGEAPKHVTPDQLHAAMSDRLKRYDAKQEERFKAQAAENAELKGMLATLMERMPAAPAAGEGAAGKGGKGGEGEGGDKQTRKETADLRRKMEAMEAERTAEKAAARTAEERTALSSALTAAGITDTKSQKAAIALLYAEEKRVMRDESGAIMFKGFDKYGEEAIDDIAKGIKEWAATDDAKPFLPAKEVRGTGTKPASGARAGNPAKGATKEEKISEAHNVVFDALKGAFGA